MAGLRLTSKTNLCRQYIQRANSARIWDQACVGQTFHINSGRTATRRREPHRSASQRNKITVTTKLTKQWILSYSSCMQPSNQPNFITIQSDKETVNIEINYDNKVATVHSIRQQSRNNSNHTTSKSQQFITTSKSQQFITYDIQVATFKTYDSKVATFHNIRHPSRNIS